MLNGVRIKEDRMEGTDYSRMGNPEVRALHAEIQALRAELGLAYKNLSSVEDQCCELENDVYVAIEVSLWRLEAIQILMEMLNKDEYHFNRWEMRECAVCDESIYLTKPDGSFITIGVHGKSCTWDGIPI
jgi:hypothetical protein